MTKSIWPSAFIAVLFAIHPLHVESVAWAAERKDVLSSLFWMLTIAAYLGYVKKPAIGRYLLIVVAFALGLMAKPMLVTLPFVLLLLDYWPLKRFGFNVDDPETLSPLRLITEKIPLFIVAAASCVTTVIFQGRGGAVIPIEMLPLNSRIANSLISYVRYIIKIFLPFDLAVLYPHLGRNLPVWQPITALVILIIISIAILYIFRRMRYLTLGWLWYLGALIPVIGLMQVGSHSIADRYTYLPSIGIFIIIAWGIAEITKNLPHKKICLGISAAIVIIALTIATRTQVGYWKNNTTLYTHTLAITDRNLIIHNNLGNDIQKQGDVNTAIYHFQKAVEINPKYAKAQYNLGNALSSLGRFEESVPHYQRTIILEPDCFDAYNNLGNSLRALNRFEEAMYQYQTVLKLKPDHITHFNIGSLLAIQGKYDQAIIHLTETLKIDPTWSQAHYILGNIYFYQNKPKLAIQHWRETINLEPESFNTYKNLSWLLSTCDDLTLRNPEEAIKLGRKAAELTNYNNPEVLDVLAAAYAVKGQLLRAIEYGVKAMDMARERGQRERADQIETRVKYYDDRRNGK